MRPYATFLLGFALWIALAWPFRMDGTPIIPDLLVGVPVSLLATWVMRERDPERLGVRFRLARLGWALVYVFEFVGAVIRANLDVAYRVLHPAMPIRPGIVRVHTSLRTDTARTMLANSITLTPGTLTVDITDDGSLFIHWIDVASGDEAEAKRRIVGRFEELLRRVFE
jgi:multicomponent Na+:H+ antiporter subunit E